MKTLPLHRLAVLAFVALAAACGPMDESEMWDAEPEFDEAGEYIGTSHDELVQTTLTCTGTSATFQIAPISTGSKTLRGRLTRAGKTTSLSCVNQTGGAVKCSELSPSTVSVTVAATGKSASLSLSTTSAKQTLRCSAPTPELTYTQMKPIVDAKCGTCHPSFTSLAGIKPMKANMAAMLKAGFMPKNDPTFNTTANGKKLIQWLETGKDL